MRSATASRTPVATSDERCERASLVSNFEKYEVTTIVIPPFGRPTAGPSPAHPILRVTHFLKTQFSNPPLTTQSRSTQSYRPASRHRRRPGPPQRGQRPYAVRPDAAVVHV